APPEIPTRPLHDALPISFQGLPGLPEEPFVLGKGGEPPLGRPPLGLAQELPRPPQPQIGLGDGEAVIQGPHGIEPAPGLGVRGVATRKQKAGLRLRATRPRSWWSWARPNRSAPSTTITEASGTSTPTST